jgi:HAD superfamily hydrolase (TIGR01509 family)
VLVFPSWTRIAETLAARGVDVAPERLAAAEPLAKRELDVQNLVRHSNDAQRGWSYFNLVLQHAGVALSEATEAALVELHAYHSKHNLWELVPEHVPRALERLRSRVKRLVVVSNANGRLHHLFDRIGLLDAVDLLFDSHHEGVEKPDPRYFEIALLRSGAAAATTIHVGDLYHVDVVGARAAGITPVLFDAADLYPDADCLRVRTLSQLAEEIAHLPLGT